MYVQKNLFPSSFFFCKKALNQLRSSSREAEVGIRAFPTAPSCDSTRLAVRQKGIFRQPMGASDRTGKVTDRALALSQWLSMSM